jgi:hypothetical protein
MLVGSVPLNRFSAINLPKWRRCGLVAAHAHSKQQGTYSSDSCGISDTNDDGNWPLSEFCPMMLRQNGADGVETTDHGMPHCATLA